MPASSVIKFETGRFRLAVGGTSVDAGSNNIHRRKGAHMTDRAVLPADYSTWLAELKQRIQTAQQRAVLAVNRELVLLYWQIGRDILERQHAQGWGR